MISAFWETEIANSLQHITVAENVTRAMIGRFVLVARQKSLIGHSLSMSLEFVSRAVRAPRYNLEEVLLGFI